MRFGMVGPSNADLEERIVDVDSEVDSLRKQLKEAGDDIKELKRWQEIQDEIMNELKVRLEMAESTIIALEDSR